MKLIDALDDILGPGVAARICSRTGLVGAVAAGLAAVELAGPAGPAAQTFSAWRDRRLKSAAPRRPVTTLDADIAAPGSAAARAGDAIDKYRGTPSISANRQVGAVASS